MTGAALIKRDVPEAVKRAVLADAVGCHYCGDLVAPLLVEHHKPLGRGGTNKRDNLVAACVSCNSQKRSMLFHEWRLYRTTNGMPWPPIASHGTDPVHYCDTCSACRRAHSQRIHEGGLSWATEWPAHGFVCKPYELNINSGSDGYVGHYQCPDGHMWKCFWGFKTWYYSDCSCTFCQVNRDDNNEKTYPAPPLWSGEHH